MALIVLTVAPSLACGRDETVVEGPGPLATPLATSPRATLKSFLDNVDSSYVTFMASREAYRHGRRLFGSDSVVRLGKVSERYLQLAVRTLDLGDVPPARLQYVGEESALQLKEILDRIGVPPLDSIPDSAEIAAVGLGRQESYRWRLPGSELDIARVTEGPRTGEFLFSRETVDRVGGDYEQVRELPYGPGATEGFYEHYVRTPGQLASPRWLLWVHYLPRWAATPYGGQTLWQWVGLGLTVLLAVLAAIGAYRGSRRIAPEGPMRRTVRRLLVPVTIAAAAAGVEYLAHYELNITGRVLVILQIAQTCVTYLAGAWALVVAATGIGDWINGSSNLQAKGVNASFVRLLFRVGAALLALVIVGFGAQELGVPVTAVITGLGVGGLAMGLAARPTIENLISGFALHADRPVRVGDYCAFGNQLGVVQEIGLRSTKIRVRDRTVMTIPNEDFAKMPIANWAKQDCIRMSTTLPLRQETSLEQLRAVLEKLPQVLTAHPKIRDKSVRVVFVGFGECSLDVKIRVYVDTTDWSEFLKVQEDAFLAAMEVVRDVGTGFAVPLRANYQLGGEGFGFTDTAEEGMAPLAGFEPGGVIDRPPKEVGS